MTPLIILLVGVPGSGKTWVCDRVKDSYHIIKHDEYLDGGYLAAIMAAARCIAKPILVETPFSMSAFMEPLCEEGLAVMPIFVIASESDLERNWDTRGTKPHARKGHLTRQNTYMARAESHGAFCGNSSDVLNHLNSLALGRED